MNPPQSGTSLTEDAVQTIGGRNTRGDKSDSPGRRNEIFTSTSPLSRIVSKTTSNNWAHVGRVYTYMPRREP
jgi:hypothetical protein